MCFGTREVIEGWQQRAKNFGDGGVARNIAVTLDSSLVVHELCLKALKVSKQLDKLWSVDVKVSAYQQRGSWRLFHEGSPGLDALRAQTIQIGINRQW